MGREGLVGIDTLLSSERALGRYVVPVSGHALAIETGRFQSALQATPELRALSESYAQAFLRKRSRPQPVTAPTWSGAVRAPGS